MLRIVYHGIFNHNVAVLKEKAGVFYVARSSDKSHYVEDYLPCCHCQQFIIKRELYRHCRRCKLRSDDQPRHYAADGRLILDGALLANRSVPKSFTSQVLTRMRDDTLTKVVKNDISIMKFGASLLRKLGPKRANDIAQRMRQLARLNVKLAEMSKGKNVWCIVLDAFLSGARFDRLIDALCQECESYEDKCGYITEEV